MSKPTKIDIEEAIAAQVEVFLDDQPRRRYGCIENCRNWIRAAIHSC